MKKSPDSGNDLQ
ncbi:Cycloartenol-C-24-methyltransferase [Zea mays]|nr:Cycloartenol-C-24-methyltransferase [Zea mays]